ncbi:hypothetical protein HJC10_11890 [Corallococcus exiguus]|uniref:hypothetical protein n=1 Tax=Corallococcus TaxID=83461 RepID=UPI000EE70BD4|nr:MULTISPECIES: hypothetical protein [Corallococcus]NNB87488.1 hypothetical protein [Corallococcus exiguus]NNB94874.1 hypothetical protein [Corallococcus exiguus]NNC03542.1 hypothetical protein [Corallococcus exiguus]NPC47292.1 hypothetical protein [Corallococcus exiguus]RKH77295.1 hypothetical protein D7X99_32085 [Corallococcus sp. AB032C]
MAMLKTFLIFILAGTLLGTFIASLAAPSYIEWNNSTPLATQTMCNLPEVVRSVTASLMHSQLMGAAIGAGVGLVAAILVVVRARSRAKQRPGSPPPAATAA